MTVSGQALFMQDTTASYGRILQLAMVGYYS